MNSEEVAKKIVKARAGLIIDQPFFGTLALRLLLKVMSPEIEAGFKARGLKPTLAVDGRTIYYNEAFIDSLDVNLTKSAFAHEVGHCVYDHIGRRKHRDPNAWNVAGDYVINAMLKDAGFALGEGWLYDAKYAGMSSDQIYNSFPPEARSGLGKPLCDIMDGTGEGKDPITEMERNDWKIATIQAANAAKAQGKLPGSIQRFVDELVNTKVDWRERLRRFVTERAKDEYTWTRPNRRYLAAGLYLPGLYSENMGTVAVVTDDSGSIGNDVLQAFASEIAGIRDSVRPRKTIVISCDAKVNHVDELEPDDEFKLKCHGGGGTDFRPPFKWLSRRGIQPAALIYLTDMYGSFPDQDPGYPVLWVAISDIVGPFGDTIKLEL